MGAHAVRPAPPRLTLRRAALLALAVAAGMGVGGCDFALSPDRFFGQFAAASYLSDDFYSLSDGEWEVAPGDGMVSQGGHLIAWEPDRWIRYRHRIPGRVEVVLAWQVWPASETPVYDNGGTHDFRIALDDFRNPDDGGPAVEVKLHNDPVYTVLRIRRGSDDPAPMEAVAMIPFVTSGVLRAVFDPWTTPPTIRAELVPTGWEIPALLLEAEAPAGWAGEVLPRLGLSGDAVNRQPRVADSVLAFAPGGE